MSFRYFKALFVFLCLLESCKSLNNGSDTSASTRHIVAKANEYYDLGEGFRSSKLQYCIASKETSADIKTKWQTAIAQAAQDLGIRGVKVLASCPPFQTPTANTPIRLNIMKESYKKYLVDKLKWPLADYAVFALNNSTISNNVELKNSLIARLKQLKPDAAADGIAQGILSKLGADDATMFVYERSSKSPDQLKRAAYFPIMLSIGGVLNHRQEKGIAGALSNFAWFCADSTGYENEFGDVGGIKFDDQEHYLIIGKFDGLSVLSKPYCFDPQGGAIQTVSKGDRDFISIIKLFHHRTDNLCFAAEYTGSGSKVKFMGVDPSASSITSECKDSTSSGEGGVSYVKVQKFMVGLGTKPLPKSADFTRLRGNDGCWQKVTGKDYSIYTNIKTKDACSGGDYYWGKPNRVTFSSLGCYQLVAKYDGLGELASVSAESNPQVASLTTKQCHSFHTKRYLPGGARIYTILASEGRPTDAQAKALYIKMSEARTLAAFKNLKFCIKSKGWVPEDSSGSCPAGSSLLALPLE